MPLGRGIVEVFEAIPERIEVEGHAPTWRVTGGSFEAVLAFAEEALGDTTVVGREDRTRWWPRVTLTLTTDPALAALAPPQETFAAPPAPPAPPVAPEPEPEPVAVVAPAPVDTTSEVRDERARLDAEDERWLDSPLESIFAYQEEVRLSRRRGVPEQRAASD